MVAPGRAARRGPSPMTPAHYWDDVAAAWRNGRQSVWRSHSDAVNLALCRRWWPDGGARRLLKTDLFDEACNRGLLPDLALSAREVVGIDGSSEVATDARARLPDALLLAADVRRLPFPAATFDLVLSNSTLDHFDRADAIGDSLRELHRVLAPGGRLILTLDNPGNPVVGLRNALPFGLLKRTGLVPYFVGKSLDVAGARREVARAGFRLEDSTAIMHCPRALAVRVADLVGWSGSVRGRAGLLSALMAFERLGRWPSRFRTGHFVALLAERI